MDDDFNFEEIQNLRQTLPTLSGNEWTVMAQDERWWVRAVLAESEHIPDPILELVSLDASDSVLQGVGANRKTPERILKRLADYKNRRVRFAVATNEGSPIHSLASDPEPSVRAGVASNPRMPFDVLFLLRQDLAVEVRRALVQNPGISNWLVDELAKDSDAEVQEYVMRIRTPFF